MYALETATFSSVRLNKSKLKAHLEPAVKLVNGSGEVDALPLCKKLAQLGPVLQAEVVSHKVSVDAVLAALLGVVQDVRGCVTREAKHFESF